jgi:hypothetical protein
MTGDEVFLYIILIIAIYLLFLALKSLFSNKSASSKVVVNKNKYRIERTKDKAANPLYSFIEIMDDKIVIDNTSFIMFSNIKKAYVEHHEHDIRLVGSLVYGGKRYKRGTIYYLGISFTNKNGCLDHLGFYSLSRTQYQIYQEIADEINAKIGYVEVNEQLGPKEL